MQHLKKKLLTENVIHVQADKGKAIVVLKPGAYTELADRHQ